MLIKTNELPLSQATTYVNIFVIFFIISAMFYSSEMLGKFKRNYNAYEEVQMNHLNVSVTYL